MPVAFLSPLPCKPDVAAGFVKPFHCMIYIWLSKKESNEE